MMFFYILLDLLSIAVALHHKPSKKKGYATLVVYRQFYRTRLQEGNIVPEPKR